MSVFGSIVTIDQVKRAVVEHVDRWIETYLAEIERQNGLDPRTINQPASYITVDDEGLNKWPEDQLPCVVVMCPGTSDTPRSTSEGVSAAFVVNIAVIVSSITAKDTSEVASYYGAAVNALMVQNQSLGGFAAGTVWRGVRLDDLAPDDGRTIAAVTNVFAVGVENVVQTGSFGLTEPPEDPYDVPDFETPESITVEVEQEAP